MDLLQTILIAAVTIGVLVTVHEFGHFWVARRCGVKVLRFAVGFGRPLLSWHDRQGTEYVIAAIPLGGYVRMVDEREGDVPEELLSQAFTQKSVQQRLAIVAAGPLANFLLAIVAFWVVFMSGVGGVAPLISEITPNSVAEHAGLAPGQELVAIDGEETPTWQAVNMRLLDRIGESGEIDFTVRYPNTDLTYHSIGVLQDWLVGEDNPDLIEGLGITPYRPAVLAVIDEVVEGSAAAQAGLQTGDQVVAVDGKAVELWSEWVDVVQANPGQALAVTVKRGNQTQLLSLTPAAKQAEDGTTFGQAGVTVKWPEWPEEQLRQFHYNPLTALVAAVERTGQLSLFTLESIKKMLEGLISPKNLSGPITIAKVATASAKSGFEAYLSFLALLSISLGVLNLLPIPVLDGGHILYGLVEWVTGKPIPERIQTIGYQAGVVVVLSLMVFAIYNDLLRL